MGASAQERKRVQAVELMCNVQSRAIDRQVADVDELRSLVLLETILGQGLMVVRSLRRMDTVELRSLVLLETILGQGLMVVRSLRRMDTVENADHDGIRTEAGVAAGVLEGLVQTIAPIVA